MKRFLISIWHKPYNSWLTVIFMLAFLTVAQASNKYPLFTTYSIEDGLPHSSVRCVFQDSYGFIWLGTGNGLSRFDGLNFKNYLFNIEDTNSIPGSTINTIQEDTLNNMHVLMIGFGNGGLAVFDYDKERFLIPSAFKSLSKQNILKIIENDINDEVYILSSSGAFLVRDKNMVFNPDYTIENIIPATGMLNMHLNNNALYVFTRGDIHIFSKITKGISMSNHKVIPLINNIKEDVSDLNFSICLGNDILFGSPGHIYTFKPETEKITPLDYSLSKSDAGKNNTEHNFIEGLLDNSGQVWIGTANKGLLRSEKGSGYKFDVINAENNNRHALQSGFVLCIYEDNSNNLWIGTYKGGVSVTNLAQNELQFYSSDLLINQTRKAVFSILPVDDSLMIFGTNSGGLYHSDIKNPDNIRELLMPDAKTSLSRQGIYTSCILDSKNRLWIGTSNNGLYCVHDVMEKDLKSMTSDLISQKKTSHFTPENTSGALHGWSIRKVYEDRYGNIWVGTWDGGLNLYLESKSSFQFFDLSDQTIASEHNKFRNIFETEKDWDSTYFVGTSSGLVLLHRNNNKKYIGLKEGMNDQNVWSITQDEEGNIWTGTTRGGINIIKLLDKNGLNANRIDKINDIQISHMNIANGLPDHNIYTLTSLDNGIWLSTENGLVYFRYKDKQFYKFNKFGAFTASEFNFGATAILPNHNKLFYGTSSGVVFFNPDSIMIDAGYKPVFLTELKIFNEIVQPEDKVANRVVLKKTMLKTDEIHIHHRERMFSISFVCPDHVNPGEINYKYKLEGFDSQWITVPPGHNAATYTNLPKDEYFFRVKASNQYGSWPETYTELKIIVHPPWWRTNLAKTAYAMALLALMTFFYQIRIRHERFKNQLIIDKIALDNQRELAQKADEVNAMKIKFFMNISHEFRTPLTLIIGPVVGLLKQINENFDKNYASNQLVLVHKNTSRLLRLINQLLDFRKLELNTYKLRVSKYNIVELVNEFFTSFAYMAERHAIQYRLISNHDIISGYVDRDILEKVMYNLLSNAFKFTPEKGSIIIKIFFEKQSRKCTISVSDTGVGIPKNELSKVFDRFYQVQSDGHRKIKGTGIGLSLIRELLEIHKGRVWVESEINQGSTFFIEFPTDETFYSEEEKSEIKSGNEENPDYYPNIGGYDLPKNVPAGTNQENATNLNKKHILIVDDNADLISFLEVELSMLFKISTAKNGLEGINIAIKNSPDFIISDIMMPEMDGFELTKKIKENRYTSHIPVILLTARSSEEDQLSAMKGGADDYIPKPFDAEILKLKIGNILKTRESLKQKFKELNATPKDIAVSSVDEQFLTSLFTIVEKRMDDPEFNVASLASELNMSRSMLFKKLKALTDETGSSFLNTMRMKRAAQILSSGHVRISEVAYKVGYVDPLYFSKSFKKYFGIAPTKYNTSGNASLKH